MSIINPFQNGNRRIFNLTISKMAWGVAVLVLTQIQGFLPDLDFISPKALKITSFAFAVLLTSSKGVEMFLDQTLQLFQSHAIPTEDTTFTTKQSGQMSQGQGQGQDAQTLNKPN